MKRTRNYFFDAFLLFFFLISITPVHSQNLVSNNGFENYSSLPNTYGQLSNAIGWGNCGGGGSPDYFNTGGTVGTYFGVNLPHTGQAMAGFCPWHGSIADYREYISSQLISPMVAGQTYSVSFWLASGINGGYGYGSNNIGVAFSSGSLTQVGSGPILITPQIEITTIFYDTAWTQFTFQVTPSSAFDYITIGNFKNDTVTSTAQYGTNYAAVYYFIDDISVQVVSGLPVAVFQSSDSAFCSEPLQCIDFFDFSTGNPTSWQWIFTGGFPSSSTLQNPTSICYSTPGRYPVTLIVTNNNGTDTLTVSPMITVGGTPPLPVITVVGGDTLISSIAYSYQWYYNGSALSAATDSFYIAHQGGTYAVKITDSIGCSSLSAGVLITSAVEFYGEEIKIFPNPVSSTFVIKARDLLNENAMIEIYNVLGEKVYTVSPVFSGGEEDVVVDIRNLAKGVYFLQLQSEKRNWSGKIVKD